MSAATFDSSCWIEIIAGGTRAENIRARIGAADLVVVPTTCLYEVRRWLLRNDDSHDDRGDEAIAYLEAQHVVPLDARIAQRAAETSITSGLPFADATILATARLYDAPLVTLDADFDGLEYATVLQ